MIDIRDSFFVCSGTLAIDFLATFPWSFWPDFCPMAPCYWPLPDAAVGADAPWTTPCTIGGPAEASVTRASSANEWPPRAPVVAAAAAAAAAAVAAVVVAAAAAAERAWPGAEPLARCWASAAVVAAAAVAKFSENAHVRKRSKRFFDNCDGLDSAIP